MINIVDKSNCCGCSACENICSQNAIEMEADTLGFLYPKVDEEKCVKCGLCTKVCQFKEDYNRYDNFLEPKVLALRLKNSEELLRSQSGGAFYALSEYVLDQGGVVYGVMFDNAFMVRHTRVQSKKERDKLRFSKYIQSDMRGIYASVKNDLKEGNLVLFSGTACQVAAIKSFVGERLSLNLLTVDIVCHGVPSPRVWSDYLSFLEKKYNSKIREVRCRDKRFGWKSLFESFEFENGEKIIRNTYNNLYFSHYTVRESCSNCHFTNLKRVGDITIGDFWGNQNFGKFSDNKGISLVLVNSQKGEILCEAISKYVDLEKSNIIDCLQPQLKNPIQLHKKRKEFVRDYEKFGFLYVAKKYGDMGWRYKLKKVKEKVKHKIRLLIKR